MTTATTMKLTSNQLAHFSVLRTNMTEDEQAQARPGWVYECESAIGANVSAQDADGRWSNVSGAMYADTARKFGVAQAHRIGGYKVVDSHYKECEEHQNPECGCPARMEWEYIGIPATGRTFKFISCTGSRMDAAWNAKTKSFDVSFTYVDGRSECFYEELCKHILTAAG